MTPALGHDVLGLHVSRDVDGLVLVCSKLFLNSFEDETVQWKRATGGR